MNNSADRERGYWERHAGGYDRSLGPLGRPLPRMLELVEEAVVGRKTVLEVAAGTGLVTPVLARSADLVVATDYAEAMIEILKSRIVWKGLKNVRCQQADIYDLPFESASFDAVVAANVLHLVPDLPSAMASLRRVMKRDGALLVPTFCHDETATSWIASRVLSLTGFPSHRRFTSRSLCEALTDSELRVRRTETLPGLIPICYVDGTFAN